MKTGKLNVGEIARRLVLKEGKIKSISHGDAREVLAILSDMLYADENKVIDRDKEGIFAALYRNGQRRAKKK